MPTVDWADQTVLARTAATLSWESVDQDGARVTPGGAVTVDVSRSDGTSIVTALATTGSNPYTAALTAAQVGSSPDQLTATWKTGATTLASTVIDVAAGSFFTVEKLRSSDPLLVDAARYPNATIARVRRVVERECELICGVSFVPRWKLVLIDGRGESQLTVPVALPRTVRTASVAGVALTAPELADLTIDGPSRAVWRPDGVVWPYGRRNVLLGIEHGYASPPPDLVEACLWRAFDLLQTPLRSRDLDRALRMTVQSGTTYDLSKPTALTTGLPAVDAVYARYSETRSKSGVLAGGMGGTGGGGAPMAAASRTLDFDPQYGSMFHGGRR